MKTLDKWQRNDIYRAIEAAGLNPEEFQWDDAADDICLRHPSSNAVLEFGGHPGSNVTRWAAGDEEGGALPKYSWNALMDRVELWLSAFEA